MSMQVSAEKVCNLPSVIMQINSGEEGFLKISNEKTRSNQINLP